jgi:hypothetical protein
MVAGTLVACTNDRGSVVSPGIPGADATLGASGVAVVTSTADAGAGSFREAILAATADPSIRFIRLGIDGATITPLQPIVFAGTQALTIQGAAILDGALLPAGSPAFVATGGGHLAIDGLTVRSAPGVGILVDVPDHATGTIRYEFSDVTVAANGSHGILINDQLEYLTDPNSISQEGSDASIEVTVRRSTSRDNGFTALDQDGIRINEGGMGTLSFTISHSLVAGNGGDGVELDERGPGDVRVRGEHVAFNGNGGFDPADYDDGIDIDESGDGSIVGAFLHASAIDNYEQGFDFNENDAGDLRIDLTDVEASGNAEEGIEYEEDDDNAGGGDIVATLIGITVRGNGSVDGDAGLKLREKGDGNLSARLIRIDADANPISGVQVREDGNGDLADAVISSSSTGNAGDGIEFDENGDGTLDVRTQQVTVTANGAAGIRADQGGTGTGRLELIAVTQAGNAFEVVANPGVTVVRKGP